MEVIPAIPVTTASTVGPVSAPVLSLVRRAVVDFNLIEPGDRVAVGMSGGKDSALLLRALMELQQHTDMDFEVIPIHLDQHQPGFARETFDRALEYMGAACEIVSEDTYSIVQSKLKPDQIPCALCGRMRRGILNKHCAAQGYTKLALGHHLDDAVETFLLNLFYQRRLSPLLPATPQQRAGVTVIRPLILVEERKIEAWVASQGIPVVECPVCDNTPRSRRRDLKQLMEQFAEINADLHASVRDAIYSNHGFLELALGEG